MIGSIAGRVELIGVAASTRRKRRDVEDMGDKVVSAVVYRTATRRTRGPDEHEFMCQRLYRRVS